VSKKVPKITSAALKIDKLMLLKAGHCLKDHALAACSLQTKSKTLMLIRESSYFDTYGCRKTWHNTYTTDSLRPIDLQRVSASGDSLK
jgi:hypothetical protein